MNAIKYRGLIYLMILILLGNISSLTGLILHPEVQYFDVEHFIVSGTSCLLVLPFFILFELYIRKNKALFVEKKFTSKGIILYGWHLASIWTVIVIASLVWNITIHQQRSAKIALDEASTILDQNLILYNWARSFQGIFVPISEQLLPNPYLPGSADHRGATDAGTPLTLINPEHLLRQVHEKRPPGTGPLSRITSLDPLRPGNAPDPWETKALEIFEHGIDEVHSTERINGEKYLRLMRPLLNEPGCLECHPASQDYGKGYIRGGISVAIPMEPLTMMSKQDIYTYCMAHGTLWFFGLLGTFLGSKRLSKSVQKRMDAETKVHSIIENMFEGLITLNDLWRIESCNPAALKMFDYSQEEILGRHIGFLVKVATNNKKLEIIERVNASLLAQAMGASIELTGERRDGSHFDVEVCLTEMFLLEKHLYIAMLSDNTERNMAQEALLESQNRIIKQEKLAALGTMVAGIAHEINNPAQAIRFSMDNLKINIDYVKMLLNEIKRYMDADQSRLAEGKEHLRRMIDEIRMDLVLEAIDDITNRNINSVDRIDNIVKSTKRMAHSEESFTECDLNTIINDAVVLTHNQVKYDLEVVLNLEPELPPFQGMAQELGQVFINLILNARDAVREKGLSREEGRITITTFYIKTRKCLEAIFEDNGSGIKQEHINKIFDPFFTTKNIGSGTGLGLSLCHRIVEAHGGEICVDSEPGKGTTFIVRVFA